MPVVVDIVARRKEESLLGDVGNLNISVGDRVIVEIDEAFETATAVSKERLIEKLKEPAYKITRKMTAEDVQRVAANKERSVQSAKTILQKIKELDLKMKLTTLEYTFDRSKLFVYYTADSRVDFRQLIKELGHLLRTRIQMVQIGVRDEAKMLGGLGHCGRLLCCWSYLKDFSPVTVDMAKQQDLSLNIVKLSGLCGRLMCCLAYEQKCYEDVNKRLPRMKSRVTTPDGPGVVVHISKLKEEVTVEFPDKKTKKYQASVLTPGK